MGGYRKPNLEEAHKFMDKCFGETSLENLIKVLMFKIAMSSLTHNFNEEVEIMGKIAKKFEDRKNGT